MNGCFRVYDNLFGKKEEKKEEETAKVEIREPPKKDYKRKYLGYFAHIIFLTLWSGLTSQSAQERSITRVLTVFLTATRRARSAARYGSTATGLRRCLA